MVLKMKAEVLTETVKRLRSGKYKQGVQRLATAEADGTYYCCLGVICEIAVEAGVITKSEAKSDWSIGKACYYYDEKYHAALPPKVVEWAGIVSEYDERNMSANVDDEEGLGRFQQGETGTYTSLAEMNDSSVPFEEIADFMEAGVVPT